MAALRVGIVGGRRAREGLGPFIARDLARAGAEVVGFAVTRAETRALAAAQLAEHAGIDAPGFTSLDALLEGAAPDAVAICTPHDAHAEALECALDAGLHVLCDKPFVWGDDFAVRTAALVARFGATDLVVYENCQWPHTLAAFDALHPGARANAPTRFFMSMQPLARGIGMLADSLPHPISLLQALCGDPTPRARAISVDAPNPEQLALAFTLATRAGEVAVDIALERSDAHPRRTRYVVDGREAAREVDPQSYALQLRAGERRVPLPDPMRAQVTDFARRAAAGHDPERAQRLEAIIGRARLLAQLVDAARAAGVA